MLAAARLLERAGPPARVRRLRPGGARSVTHAILRAFAEHVEAEARLKHARLAALAAAAPPARASAEARLRAERSAAVAALLKRLWVLLQAALAAGAPAIAVGARRFPAPPPGAVCDLDLVWSGICSFASGWVEGPWQRSTHYLYHPAFRAGVRAFALAALARGVPGARGPESARAALTLPPGVLERVVAFAAEDQAAWAPVLD
jgi:hypothetical protein